MSIVIKSLSHIYHEKTALRTAALEDINVTIDRKEWVSVIGHTGSGKSTLAQHLNAILRPTSGSVTVDGMTILPEQRKEKVDFREIRRKVGLIFQYPEQQLFEETVQAELAFAPRNWGIPESQIPGLVRQAMQSVGLDESYLSRSPFELSGGEKRRVAIASVLTCSPSYLVLDEPTAGLDLRGRSTLLDLLKGIHRAGVCIVLITHDLEVAFSCSDRIVMLHKGRCMGVGTPEETARRLYADPVPGLILPEVMQTALTLRKKGFRVPLTCDPDKLAQALIRERRRSR